MQSLIAGIVLGLGVAIPIGPVNILIMQYALRSFWLGLALGAGAMAADAFFLIALSYGLLQLLDHKIVLDLITIFGAIFLLYISFSLYRGASSAIQTSAQSSSGFSAKAILPAFAKGFALNLINPYVIIFWLSVAGFVASEQNSKLALSGLLIAISSWIIFLPLITSRTGKLLSPKVARIIAYSSSALIAIFALSLIIKRFILGD